MCFKDVFELQKKYIEIVIQLQNMVTRYKIKNA